MDILDAPTIGPPPGDEPAKVGRPSMDATKRAISDEKYMKTLEMLEAIPSSTMELRFQVYRGSMRTGQKRDFKPRQVILLSQFKDLNLKDEHTLAAYLKEKHGEGFYTVEAFDQHGTRLDKIPIIKVEAGDIDMDDDDQDYDDDRQDRPRRRRRPSWKDRDDWEDDDGDARANTADLMQTVSRQQTAQVSQVAKSSNDMMTMLMMSNQQAAETRRLEDQRREDNRAEERKREETRAEERRREQEDERKEERIREERRREEAREERKRDDDKRASEQRSFMEASNRKTELIIGALTAIAPLIGKVMEPKEDKTLPLLISSMQKPPDPMLSVLLQSILAKANDPGATGMMMQQMMEMSKMSSMMNAEQFKSVLAMSNDMNGVMMKKAMDMMLASPQGQTAEGKSMIEQVMGLLGTAAEIVKPFMTQAAQPVPQVQQQQQRPMRAIQHTPAQPAAVQAVPVPPPVPMTPDGTVIALNHPDGRPKTPAEIHIETLTPEQQAAEMQEVPKGVPAVLGCLRALHTKQYGSQTEYQQIIGYMVQEMPLNLRVAILDANEMEVVTIVTPAAQADAELLTWLMTPEQQTPEGPVISTFAWIRAFVANLPPSIEAIHGPADAQRAQLAAGMPDQGVITPTAIETAPDASQAPAVAEATTDAVPVPTGEAAPIIPGPGSEGGPQSPLNPDPDAP